MKYMNKIICIAITSILCLPAFADHPFTQTIFNFTSHKIQVKIQPSSPYNMYFDHETPDTYVLDPNSVSKPIHYTVEQVHSGSGYFKKSESKGSFYMNVCLYDNGICDKQLGSFELKSDAAGYDHGGVDVTSDSKTHLHETNFDHKDFKCAHVISLANHHDSSYQLVLKQEGLSSCK